MRIARDSGSRSFEEDLAAEEVGGGFVGWILCDSIFEKLGKIDLLEDGIGIEEGIELCIFHV